MRPSFRFAREIGRLLLLLACAAAAPRPALSQPPVTATSGSPGVIASIRAEFAQTEREAAGYRRTTHDVQDFSLEGGVLTGFYRGRELRKLGVRLYGESWRGTEDYYFTGGRLNFVHVVQERYEEPYGGRVQWTIEHRFYLDGGRLIRRIATVRPAPGAEDLSIYDPDLPLLLRKAELFAACAAAPGRSPAQCTAPKWVLFGDPPPLDSVIRPGGGQGRR
jgi:hypothetical protein